jgi:uncharacterized repeat protein (TIGR03803 family)
VYLLMMAMQPAEAQTFTVLHAFSGGADGSQPGELAIDGAGNLYGSAWGGSYGGGFVYQLKRSDNGWIFNPLHMFQGGNDGNEPGPLIFGPDGALYGTTSYGGIYGSGTVFKLTPPPTACHTALCPWVKTILHNFTGGNDGASPEGPVAFAPDGGIYGVTGLGGTYNLGVIFKLTYSNGGWTESVLHTDTEADGYGPYDGVIADQAGNVYGVYGYGGSSPCYYMNGTVYEVSPSGSGWTFNIVHCFTFQNDGSFPTGGVILDSSGNLLGTTNSGPGNFSDNGGGVFFSLSPSNGMWTESLLHNFLGRWGGGPYASLTMDASGAVYGTTIYDGSAGFGSAFKLTPSNGVWTYRTLHNFTYYNDGAYPQSNLVFDAEGNLFGTTTFAGPGGYGVVFEITP